MKRTTFRYFALTMAALVLFSMLSVFSGCTAPAVDPDTTAAPDEASGGVIAADVSADSVYAANDILALTSGGTVHEHVATYYDPYGIEYSSFTVYIFESEGALHSIVKYALDDESICYEWNLNSLVYKLIGDELTAYCFVPETGSPSFSMENEWFAINDFAKGAEVVESSKDGVELSVTFKKKASESELITMRALNHTLTEDSDVFYRCVCDAITLELISYTSYYKNSSGNDIKMLEYTSPRQAQQENIRKTLLSRFKSDATRTVTVIVDPGTASERVLLYVVPVHADDRIQPLEGYSVYSDAAGTAPFDHESISADASGNYADLTVYYIKN